MISKLYGRWMTAWETALTMRDENRVVRPVEWGFDWLEDFIETAGLRTVVDRAEKDPATAEAAGVGRLRSKGRHGNSRCGGKREDHFA